MLNPPNSARSYSSLLSEHPSYTNSVEDDSTLDGTGRGWRANFGNTWPNFHMTIDLGEERPITGVVTQKTTHNQWVTQYTVKSCGVGSSAADTCSWLNVAGGTVFAGNTAEQSLDDYA